jgi:DNA-binding response OmpR family regulator
MIEDDPDTEAIARYFLTSAGFQFNSAAEGRAGLRQVQETSPDLVILDLSLPDIDGTEVCRQIRRSRDIPVVILTGRGSEQDILAGFSEGADDYIKKPMSPQELVARVQAVLRRAKPDPIRDTRDRMITHGDVSLDLAKHRVMVAGEELHVTATEMRILVLLLKDPGRVVSREEIMRVIHGNTYARDPRTVDSHVSHLRHKLRVAPHGRQRIQNVYGLGYRFAT